MPLILRKDYKMSKSKFSELATVEEKDAASLEASILAEIELIAQKRQKNVPANQDYFEGMTGFWSKKLEEVAYKMSENKSFKSKVMFQFQMRPFDDKERKGFIKGMAMQRFINDYSKENQSTLTQRYVAQQISATR